MAGKPTDMPRRRHRTTPTPTATWSNSAVEIQVKSWTTVTSTGYYTTEGMKKIL
jgi:hypothetical protein